LKGQNEIYRYLLSLKTDPYLRDDSGNVSLLPEPTTHHGSPDVSNDSRAANRPGVDRVLSGTDLYRNVSSTARAASRESYELFINTESLDQQEFKILHLIVLGLHHIDLDLMLRHQIGVDPPDIYGRTPLI
jgi:hypothetical protein